METEKEVENKDAPVITEEKKQVRLADIPITDENAALNVVISFLHLAQRRGAFQFDESAKILECVRFFSERR